jgi:hypothetical protein
LTTRVLVELFGIIVAGFLAFFVGIALKACMILLWLCEIRWVIDVASLAVAAIVYAFTGKLHDLTLALVYLRYAAGPFVITCVLAYHHGKIVDLRKQRIVGRPLGFRQ